MKPLWLIATIGAFALVPCPSKAADPAPAPAAVAAAAIGEYFTVYGAVLRQGRYDLGPAMTIKDALESAGGTKETDSLNKIKLIRKMKSGEKVSIYINLKRADHNLPLMPNDLIIVDEKMDPNF